ncbi:MAG TPA: polysaccharide deacetylase family protein, partial [Candidatus Synoicihabitans sp.]|nr:polysaccharide deacetylase family protein [Candidatus Synoicihabitans sp.]
PSAFEAQLAHLRAEGYRSATPEEWQTAVRTRRPLTGRRVLITFDDGYRDFSTDDWPLLRKYDFAPTVFLPTGHIGGTSRWDSVYGEPAPLMTWDDIRRLAAEGVRFGAHTATHPMLGSLAPTEVAREFLQSRTVLRRALGEPVDLVAYPFGDYDSVVRVVAAACGFTMGFTCNSRRCALGDDLLTLPRLEITDATSLTDFRHLLGEAVAVPPVLSTPATELPAASQLLSR